ncbi:11724_t:CDS:1 [Ambispora gerdemannii]|uniref:11724_t:CDS:1 n=1 Tax=Ambispora gerdemannii TaxID=144530 RepID=A0A9N9G364_9GLOM|nr:11724_t:CDS:1 [Ambispora gerdemannii]
MEKKESAPDTTGHKYIFKVRGESYPPLRRTHRRKFSSDEDLRKKCNEHDEYDQYIEFLEAKLNDLEYVIKELVNNQVDISLESGSVFDFSQIVSMKPLYFSNGIVKYQY